VSRGAVRIRASSETLYREPCFPDHDSTSVSKFTAGLPRSGRATTAVRTANGLLPVVWQYTG